MELSRGRLLNHIRPEKPYILSFLTYVMDRWKETTGFIQELGEWSDANEYGVLNCKESSK